MKDLEKSKLFSFSDWYKTKVLNQAGFGKVKGLTRPILILDKIAVELLTEGREDHYKFTIDGGKKRRFSNLEDIEKYITSEHWVTNLLIRELDEDSIFYDVGGFHGYHSIVGSISEKVFVFEPDPENLEILKENIRLNSGQNISVIESPLWKEKKKVKLDAGKKGKTNISDEGIEKRAETLDNFVFGQDNSPPDLIKIDVEGAEYRVLQGAEKVLEEHKPELIIEVHKKGGIEKIGGSEEELFSFLESKQYDLVDKKDLGGRMHCFFT